MKDTAIVIMTKVPIPGQVKTRLGDLLTPVQCAELYRCFLLDTIDCALHFGGKVYAAFTPESGRRIMENLVPPEVSLFPQAGDNLGERMSNAARYVLGKGYKNCLVIGADIPTLQPLHLERAAKLLEKIELVLGPSRDGGYYLIGLKDSMPLLFENILWGTELVLAQTLDRAEKMGICVSKLPVLNDVDYYSDFKELYFTLEKNSPALTLFPQRTWSFYKKINLKL